MLVTGKMLFWATTCIVQLKRDITENNGSGDTEFLPQILRI